MFDWGLTGGGASRLIGSFLQDAKGQLCAKRKELEELHLKVPDNFGTEDEVPLANLRGVSYRYDEARQTVDITVDDQGRLPQSYDLRAEDLRGVAKPIPVTPPATGAVLNYLLFGGSSGNSIITNWQFQDPMGRWIATGPLAGGCYHLLWRRPCKP